MWEIWGEVQGWGTFALSVVTKIRWSLKFQLQFQPDALLSGVHTGGVSAFFPEKRE